MDQQVFLKIKAKSLASEARFIRKEELRMKHKLKDGRERTAEQSGELAWRRESLWKHRTNVVRPEARATQLARGFLRGRTYRDLEPNAKSTPSWVATKRMVERYGQTGDSQRFDEWVKAAQE